MVMLWLKKKDYKCSCKNNTWFPHKSWDQRCSAICLSTGALVRRICMYARTRIQWCTLMENSSKTSNPSVKTSSQSLSQTMCVWETERVTERGKEMVKGGIWPRSHRDASLETRKTTVFHCFPGARLACTPLLRRVLLFFFFFFLHIQ